MKCDPVALDNNWLGHTHSAYHWFIKTANVSKKCDWRTIGATAKWSDLEHMTSMRQVGKYHWTGACKGVRGMCPTVIINSHHVKYEFIANNVTYIFP